MLFKKSLNNITSLGDGQQTVKMQVCLVKTSFSPLHDPLSSCEARGSATLGHKFTHFAYHRKANLFCKGWISRVQQYIYNNLFPLVWWMGAKKRTQTVSHSVILFKSFEQLCLLMCKEGIFWGSICADGGAVVVFKSFFTSIVSLSCFLLHDHLAGKTVALLLKQQNTLS